MSATTASTTITSFTSSAVNTVLSFTRSLEYNISEFQCNVSLTLCGAARIVESYSNLDIFMCTFCSPSGRKWQVGIFSSLLQGCQTNAQAAQQIRCHSEQWHRSESDALQACSSAGAVEYMAAMLRHGLTSDVRGWEARVGPMFPGLRSWASAAYQGGPRMS